MTTVLICDDHLHTREGLRQSVQAVPGVQRVDVATSGEEVLARWPSERHDLVFMGMQTAGLSGLETIRRLVQKHPEANIVMLTGAQDRDTAAVAISSGARGYLHRDASREELCAAVANAVAAAELAGGLEPRPTVDGQKAPDLTEREMQVLQGMAAGRSNAQIGRELYLSEDTIKTHARRLFRKMRVNDRAQAVAAGFRHGLVR